jgi:methionine-rich copper-binding protein CopC
MRRRVATVLAGALLATVAAAPALGHSDVASSSPARGAVLVRVPAQMKVTFSEPIGRLGVMTMTRNGRGNLVKTARRAPNDARTAVIGLKRPGPRNQPGTYRLTWRIVGADGHAVSGVIAFRVRR